MGQNPEMGQGCWINLVIAQSYITSISFIGNPGLPREGRANQDGEEGAQDHTDPESDDLEC